VTVDRAQRDLTKTKLYSPCDCVVQAVNLNVGADAGSGVSLMDMSQLRFHTASLNEQNVVKLKEGQKVEIRLKAFDKTFTGKVGYIVPMSTSTSDSLALFTAIIELDEMDAGLLPGMTGQATIYLQ
jgi:HlyD family secretion protein